MQRYSVIGIDRLQENSQRNPNHKEMESGGLGRSLPAITKSFLVCKHQCQKLLVSNLFHNLCKFYISKIIENATKIFTVSRLFVFIKIHSRKLSRYFTLTEAFHNQILKDISKWRWLLLLNTNILSQIITMTSDFSLIKRLTNEKRVSVAM